MKRPQLSLKCSCGDTMQATVSPASKVPALVEIFLTVHDGPEHIVRDRDGAVVPVPAAVEVRAAGATELPGFSEVAQRPAEKGGYPL